MSGKFEERDNDSTTVGVYRTSATVAGGRRFSFSALVVVGDKNGSVGVGYAKSNQVPQSVEKAQKEGRRKMRRYPLQGRTIPHSIEGRFGASKVRLVPAAPGTGVIAGAAVRAILDMIGVQDCLTKCYGSSNPKNLVKATLAALDTLRTRETVESLRGVTLETTAVEDAIRKGAAAMPVRRGDKAQAPVNTVGDDRRGGRGGRGGPGRGPGRGRGGFEGGAPSAPSAASAPSAPAAPEGGAGESPAAQ
jgi:small subunit ribosomal protein S5